MPPPGHLPESAFAPLRLVGLDLADVFLSPASNFSLLSLVAALCVAALLVARSRRRRGRRVRARVLLRALFPRGMWRRPTTRADLGFFALNITVTGSLIGWALISTGAIGRGTQAMLTSWAGAAPLGHAPAWIAAPVTTLALFFAYEFGYYVDHWLSHHVPALWEIHKPHHSAEALTPLTLFRVHPLETLKFANILALTMGVTGGLCGWALGGGHEVTASGRNVVFAGLWLAFGHLQHTNLWIVFPGLWGRLLISPAHHQIHHSDNPRDFGRNLGSFLTVFDRLFGTLRHPARERERLSFGVDGDRARTHGVAGGLIDPVTQAAAALVPRLGSPARPTEPQAAAQAATSA